MFVTFITIDIISELVKFDHYRDTRAAILDPCIQGILLLETSSDQNFKYPTKYFHVLCPKLNIWTDVASSYVNRCLYSHQKLKAKLLIYLEEGANFNFEFDLIL